MKTTKEYVFFWKTEEVFSQWHLSVFTVDGVTYKTAEQYMMHMKALTFGDNDAAEKVMKTTDPREQKKIGRQVRNFDAAKWSSISWDVVYRGNYAKFTQNEDMKKQLLDTGDRELVEASPYDTIWGIGLSENDPRALDKSQWLGTNWLGEVLTKVRDDIKNQK